MNTTSKYVVDSSALLAVIYDETGRAEVEKILIHAVISAVNFSEMIGKLALDGIPADKSANDLTGMVHSIIPFDREIAFIAGRMAPKTRSLGLSLGDRACLATAEHLGMEAVTADKVWAKYKGPVKIKLIR